MIVSTYRLTEHHTTGPMSRNLPWLAELQPELFAEIDPVLAADRGIEDGGWMVICDRARRDRGAGRRSPGASGRCGSTARSCTRSPCRGTGAPTRRSEQGVTGDSLNDLIVLSGDPNTSIEDKTFSCQVRAGRRHGETTERLRGVHGGEMDTAADHPAETPDRVHETPQSGDQA